jgi:hypothetical protein
MLPEEWMQKTRLLLHHNVPRFIAHIKNRGGVSEEEWLWIQSEEYTNPEVPQGMLAMADKYLLLANKYQKHLSAAKYLDKGLFVLVKAIAILSFCPGGVHLFDLYFSSDIKGFVREEATRYWYAKRKA